MAVTTRVKVDLCIIGMDPAGYDLALAAAQLGAKVVLVTHRQSAGGVLLASGRVFSRLPRPLASPAELRDAIRACMAEADKERSLHRPPALGITVIDDRARFVAPDRLEAGEHMIAARRFVLATGRDSPLFPQDDPRGGFNPFLAGEDLPRALRLVGHGAEAAAIAQRLAQAGIPVELDTGEAGLLPGHDPEAVAILATALQRDGVTIRTTAQGAMPSALAAIDVSVPRHVTGVLDPEKAGLALVDGRPVSDASLRTTNKRVFAIGALTQSAFGVQSGLVVDGESQIGWLIAKLLFRSLGAYPAPLAMRHVGTSPALIELAAPDFAPGDMVHIRAARRHRIHREAISLGSGQPGFIKATTDGKGRLLGVVILAEAAATHAAPWALAIQRREALAALSGLPAFPGDPADAARLLALQPARKRLQSPRLQGLVRFFAKFG